MTWISKAWKCISFLGLDDQSSIRKRTIILSNQLNATLFLLMVILSLSMWYIRMLNNSVITLASYRLMWMMGINILHILLSYYKHPKWAKAILILSAPLIFIVIPTFMGFVENDSFFSYSAIIIALSLIPQLLIKPSANKYLYTLSMAYYLFLLIINDDLILHYGPNTLASKAIYSSFQIYAEITNIAIFLFINSSVFYLKWLNNNYEKKLIKNNQRLDQHLEELKATNEHLRVTQEQLVHSEKMATLGILTAGVAHEINTPLNFISTSSLLIKNRIDDLQDGVTPQDLESNLIQANEILDKGVEQAAFIVTSLMTFSYDGKSKKALYDVRSIVKSTLLFLKCKIPVDLNVEQQYELKEPIYVFAEKIHQVVLNIIDNAICASLEAKDKLIKVHCYPLTQAGIKYACISIFNKGAGIEDKIGKRILDPFFTTKSINSGTGLGLSTAFNLVKDHKGTLAYKNHDGGVEFIIKLPISGE
ncbi:sensor histidine kinase [Carboxylicivirga sp. M1479]|uniref:sensor histidine kinase n=1 Tax=Carboxylicivirga sp. M1479 TaxID=2594476 RepID=UPI0011788ABE|nr:ATP-binding protein [Carboxylicivirga sp. M1479]TRX71413.1 GHKL domain-containing protein [Carboxylicivirga sp. M1479]